MRAATFLLFTSLIVCACAVRLTWYSSGDCSGDGHDVSFGFGDCVRVWFDKSWKATEENNQVRFCTYESSGCDENTNSSCDVETYGTCKRLISDDVSFRVTSGASQATFGIIGVVVTLVALFF